MQEGRSLRETIGDSDISIRKHHKICDGKFTQHLYDKFPFTPQVVLFINTNEECFNLLLSLRGMLSLKKWLLPHNTRSPCLTLVLLSIGLPLTHVLQRKEKKSLVVLFIQQFTEHEKKIVIS